MHHRHHIGQMGGHIAAKMIDNTSHIDISIEVNINYKMNYRQNRMCAATECSLDE